VSRSTSGTLTFAETDDDLLGDPRLDGVRIISGDA
jgi:hypothetical protein